MKLRVLHIVLSLETGGLENGIVNLINCHDQAAFKVDVLCLSARGELADRIGNPDTEVIFDTPTQGVVDSAKKIRTIVKQKGYHIVHAHGWATMLASYLGLLGVFGVKLINGEHGVLYDKSNMEIFIQRFLFKRMVINLSVSANLARDIARRFGVNEKRFHAIINGVDVDRFQPNEEYKSAVRNELSIPKDAFVIGTVGRMEPVKNYPHLISSFDKAWQANNFLYLLMVGAGSEFENLKKQAGELSSSSNIVFAGRRSDINKVMNAMSLFVLPSFSEGLSNTILEAFATGLPVLASNVGGNPEIVSPGHNGYLFTVDDTDELADHLIKFSQDESLYKKFVVNAREDAVNEHSIPAMVAGYEGAYSNVMNGTLR